MNAIVNVDKNWAIGNKGELLVRISSDLKRFKSLTSGKVVVLGRKTMDTFPGRKPLKNRTNIILSRDKDYVVEGGIVVHSVEELMEELKKYPSEDVFVIGGESIYRQMLPYCDTVYVTKVDHETEADSFYPDLDSDPEWKVRQTSEMQTDFDIPYYYVDYVKTT